jgi:hypothetical protein
MLSGLMFLLQFKAIDGILSCAMSQSFAARWLCWTEFLVLSCTLHEFGSTTDKSELHEQRI